MRGRSLLVIALAGVSLPAPCHAGDEFDFDLLGDAPPPPIVDTAAVEWRRTLLNVHQGLGLGLLLATASLCVVGQLSYNDFYHGGQSGRFEPAHAYLAYGTAGLFAATGAAAILAPLPFEREAQGLDRTLAHKVALATAGVAMLAGGGLGLYAAGRTGRLDQQGYTKVHLGVSYAALASLVVGVGVLVF